MQRVAPDVHNEIYGTQLDFNLEPSLSKLYLQCSGCGDAIYCSKRCQRFHWKESHRTSCQPLESVPHRPLGRMSFKTSSLVCTLTLHGFDEGRDMAVDVRENTAQSVIAYADIRRFAEEIDLLRLEYLRRHPTVSPRLLVVNVDYSTGPQSSSRPFIFRIVTLRDVVDWEMKDMQVICLLVSGLLNIAMMDKGTHFTVTLLLGSIRREIFVTLPCLGT